MIIKSEAQLKKFIRAELCKKKMRATDLGVNLQFLLHADRTLLFFEASEILHDLGYTIELRPKVKR